MSFQANMERSIAFYGWSVVAVFADESSPVPFAYTIGLTESFERPEMLLVGLGPLPAQQILNLMVERMKELRRPFADGEVVLEVANMPLVVKDVPLHKALPFAAQAFYRYADKRPVRFQQVVLPDEKALFPWEDGYDETSGKMRVIQPDLWK